MEKIIELAIEKGWKPETFPYEFKEESPLEKVTFTKNNKCAWFIHIPSKTNIWGMEVPATQEIKYWAIADLIDEKTLDLLNVRKYNTIEELLEKE